MCTFNPLPKNSAPHSLQGNLGVPSKMISRPGCSRR
eukprot:02383.XXX_29211_29318_1 [CDS] Oithona nana genome sequencing.